MPFMRGPMPLRRTLFYLQQVILNLFKKTKFFFIQGKVILRDNVSILMFGYHIQPLPEQQGAADFIFWHWAQVQFKNPHIQMVRKTDYCPTPFIMAFLS